MKKYTIQFKEPIPHTHKDERFNRETRRWEEIEVTEMVTSITLSSLSEAKRIIKTNLDKYTGSCITQTWSDGNFENLGEIKLSGSNKTFVANTRQRVASY